MTFADWVKSLVDIANTIVVPAIIGLAVLVFIWGVAKYFILAGDNEDKREEGKQFAFWGIIGMVLLLGVWGLVRLFLTTLGFA